MEYRTISLGDPEYPPLLREMYNPPERLFIKGKLLPTEEYIAVVGSRTPTFYGEKVTKLFVHELARAGVTIVSGLAYGIDALAHEEALRAGGRTVAILGFGIDQMYPQENKKLADRIIKNGALLSEFPLGTQARPHHFPQRNRTISGMAKATLVIEAAEKSGALITAAFALEQNREVFTVPGPIDQPLSKGTNMLIRNAGAFLVTHPSEILEELALSLPQTQMPLFPTEKLTRDEERVSRALRKGPLLLDELSVTLKILPEQLMTLLTSLELKGLVRKNGGRVQLIL